MIAWSLRGLARLVALVVLLVLAILAGATAVGAIIAPDGVDRIADTARGPEARQDATDGLAELEAPGPVAVQGAIIGGAMLLGGVLVAVGCVVPARSKLVRVGTEGDEAKVSARPKALAAAGRALAEDVPGAEHVRVKVRARRRRAGGSMRVNARSALGRDAGEVGDGVRAGVDGLADGFSLGAKVRTRAAVEPKAGRSGARRVA